jgi:hypothetical protein
MSKRGFMLIIVMAVAVVALASGPALAQCPMCKQAVEASADPEAISGGLNLAVLVLLIPPVALFAGIFGIFYRYRDFHGNKEDRQDCP